MASPEGDDPQSPDTTPDTPSPAADDQPTPVQQRGMRLAIMTQMIGAMPLLIFTNGVLLLYLTVLDFSSERIIFYLSLPMIAQMLLVVPMAFASDRFGKKLIGEIGSVLQTIGIALIAAAAFLEGDLMRLCVITGLGTLVGGVAVFTAGWFALLDPLVPTGLRGRFFGKLRVSWQMVGIVFATGCAMYLDADSPAWQFQAVLGTIALLMFIRLPLYIKIPELEPPSKNASERVGFRDSVSLALRAPGLMSFSAYLFLLYLFVGALPSVFGLIEKRVLGFGDNTVVWMGNLHMIGSALGFFLGGKAVDRWGTKPVFLFCHFGFAAVIAGFIFRDWWPFVIAAASFAHLGFGVCWAAGSIAISTETLALVPPTQKSMGTSIVRTMNMAGASAAGIASAGALKMGILSEEWLLAGNMMTRFDTVLLVSGVMVLLLVVTLGLVPSVLRPHMPFPRE